MEVWAPARATGNTLLQPTPALCTAAYTASIRPRTRLRADHPTVRAARGSCVQRTRLPAAHTAARSWTCPDPRCPPSPSLPVQAVANCATGLMLGLLEAAGRVQLLRQLLRQRRSRRAPARQPWQRHQSAHTRKSPEQPTVDRLCFADRPLPVSMMFLAFIMPRWAHARLCNSTPCCPCADSHHVFGTVQQHPP